MKTVIPFWLQKGIKNWKFVDANIFFEKYGPSAFQNRSRNPSTISGYDFMLIWSLVEMTQKKRGALKKKNVTLWKFTIFDIFANFWILGPTTL